jgi:AraC-like DNA-binding protein
MRRILGKHGRRHFRLEDMILQFWGQAGMHRHSYDDAVQRAGVFAELPPFLAARGVDPQEVFRGLSIDAAALKHDTKVPLAAMLVGLDSAARRLDCPHLGLLLGARFSFAIHGPIGRLMRSAATLEEAMIDFVTWQQGYSDGAVVYLNKVAGGAAFGFGAYVRSVPGTRQLYDAAVAVGCAMVSTLTEGRVKPAEILLSYRRPDDVRPYLRDLAEHVRFDQPQSCLILDSRALGSTLPSHDPAARRQALADLEALADRTAPSLSARVMHRMRPLLHAGTPGLEALATALGLHPRTLRRRMAAEGTTFEEIRDRVRFTLARELLDMTDLPIGEVSDAVAYASHGAFIAAFHRWTGTTPGRWRARQA